MNGIERWKTVVNYPDYEVSDMGNIRRVRIHSKLTVEDVAVCRALREQGLLYREIAGRFNVTDVAVRIALTYKAKRRQHREPYRLLRPQKSTTGCTIIGLSKNGKVRGRMIHQLVMEAFVGPRPQGNEINHKNGIRTDARLQNLEYITHSENALHAFRELHNPRKKPTPKTHCIRGHEFTPENTYVRPRGKGRVCKACNPHAWSGYK